MDINNAQFLFMYKHSPEISSKTRVAVEKKVIHISRISHWISSTINIKYYERKLWPLQKKVIRKVEKWLTS